MGKDTTKSRLGKRNNKTSTLIYNSFFVRTFPLQILQIPLQLGVSVVRFNSAGISHTEIWHRYPKWTPYLKPEMPFKDPSFLGIYMLHFRVGGWVGGVGSFEYFDARHPSTKRINHSWDERHFLSLKSSPAGTWNVTFEDYTRLYPRLPDTKREELWMMQCWKFLVGSCFIQSNCLLALEKLSAL